MLIFAPLFFTLAVLVILAESGTVSEITPANFESWVLNSQNLWIIEFYSPSCPHCQKFAPEYENVADQLSGSDIKVGRIDGVQYGSLADQFNVGGFPTVKMFKPGSSVPETYNGPRRASDIIDTAKALQQSKHIRSFGMAYISLPQTPRDRQSIRMDRQMDGYTHHITA